MQELLHEYAAGPQHLEQSLKGVTEEQLDHHPIAGAWSIRQVVCHLADSEIVYADRIKRVLAEENPLLFEADPNLFVPRLCGSNRTIEAELNVIKSLRSHMMPILLHLSVPDFQRTGRHSLDGPMTLETLVRRITSHIPHHIAFIRTKLEKMRGEMSD